MKSFIKSRPSKPARLDGAFYQEISSAWERRARRLQARRWEIIKKREAADRGYARLGSH
jgi:hypothetical protein